MNKRTITAQASVENVTMSYNVSLFLDGDPGLGDCFFLMLFNNQILLETKWVDQSNDLHVSLPLDLNNSYHQSLIADSPLIFILRAIGGKGSKEHDPLLNVDNKAGGTVDLFPFVLGESKINLRVPLNPMQSDTKFNCFVEVCIKPSEEININIETVPLTLTLMSAHCLPPLKEGTVYVSAMEIANIHIDTPPVVNFGMSISNSMATKIVWASASNAGQAANTNYNVPVEDKFVPADLETKATENCTSFYWNSMRRMLVDPAKLRERLRSFFVIEIAAVPKLGKIEVRGRYLAFVDAGVLLEPRQYGVTTCAKVYPYSDTILPENIGTILDLPPSSAKSSVREPCILIDEYGHDPYIVLRFDLSEPLTPKIRSASYYEIIGFPPPDGHLLPINEMTYIQSPGESKLIDTRNIKREAGALAVHEELSKLSYVASVKPSIKRSAASNLSSRIRFMLKQFPVEKIDNWQDIVTAQHRALIRSVSASFAPQDEPPKQAPQFAAVRSRLAGNTRITNQNIETSLQSAPDHPRILFSKALRCLESRNDTEARNYLLRSLHSQPRNRYLLWTLGGIDFNKFETKAIASAAFHISVQGDVSDGITGAIGWAALHTLSHFWNHSYAAFVAAKKMRKYFELVKTWDTLFERWINISGEEEIYWNPTAISVKDPFLIASAFCLCLRCFDFSAKLLECFKNGCTTRDLSFGFAPAIISDMNYLRIASLVLRKQVNDALILTEDTVRKVGPSENMSQIRATCLVLLEKWNTDCEKAVYEADRAGAKPCPFLLYRTALGEINTDPKAALQYAARAYKVNPSPFIALLIARIYAKMGDDELAKRWAAAAVNQEPLLADGWAFLAILAMREKDIIQAKSMLRTQKQTGPLSFDIEKELMKMMKANAKTIKTLSYSMVENICFCEYY